MKLFFYLPLRLSVVYSRGSYLGVPWGYLVNVTEGYVSLFEFWIKKFSKILG